MQDNADDPGFDLLAASLRADRSDMAAFVEALAVRLQDALPSHCHIERRRRGVFARGTRVERVVVELGKRRFVLHWRRHALVAEVESIVHDMRRTREQVALEAWLAALQTQLHQQASSSAEARVALERLLDA